MRMINVEIWLAITGVGFCDGHQLLTSSMVRDASKFDPNKPFEPNIFASITVLTPAIRLFSNGLNPCTDLFSKPAGALRDRFTLWTDAPSLRGATHFDVGLFEGSIRYIRPGS